MAFRRCQPGWCSRGSALGIIIVTLFGPGLGGGCQYILGIEDPIDPPPGADAGAIDGPPAPTSDAVPADARPNSPTPWINEFHYDNTGDDVGEFIEIAGPADTNVQGWRLHGYNGSGGTDYGSVGLIGTIADQMSGYGTIAVDFQMLQNDTDGMALVSPQGEVVQFLSYEGTFVAVDGPAADMESVDVGVTEPAGTPIGRSLQLGGAGCAPEDFSWQEPTANTRGNLNSGQSFVCQ